MSFAMIEKKKVCSDGRRLVKGQAAVASQRESSFCQRERCELTIASKAC